MHEPREAGCAILGGRVVILHSQASHNNWIGHASGISCTGLGQIVAVFALNGFQGIERGHIVLAAASDGVEEVRVSGRRA